MVLTKLSIREPLAVLKWQWRKLILTEHDEPLAILICHKTDGDGRADLEVVGKEAPVPAANTLWFK